MPRKQDDDEDDRPRRRRPTDDDDDDRPSARRKAKRDDDDDDRPTVRRKPRRDEEEEDDDRPTVRRRRNLDDNNDEPRPMRGRKKAKPQQVSVVGIISLIIGIGALPISLFPYIGAIALIPGVLALLLGVTGLVVAKKSRGRQGTGIPVAGISVSSAAILVALGWLIYGHIQTNRVRRDLDEMGLTRDQQDELLKAVEQRRAAEAKDFARVKSAVAPPRISAQQFADAYERNADQADRIYKNKVIEVTGTVDEVDLESGITSFIVYLKLRGDETIRCNFPWNDANRARLSRLQPGTAVIIRGLCEGDVASLDVCMLVD
jgi:tRNA_anti-like